MVAADSPLRTGSHRHIWRQQGRVLEVCANCPAARPRSRLPRAFSFVVLALGLLAAVGMFAGIQREGPLKLATSSSCAGFVQHAVGGGC
ncbi:MAG TPA: hypothetical protein VFY49_10540 [Myxococcota bacterium]|nr:hypothetical protein [Myxococcota bacterium]